MFWNVLKELWQFISKKVKKGFFINQPVYIYISKQGELAPDSDITYGLVLV